MSEVNDDLSALFAEDASAGEAVKEDSLVRAKKLAQRMIEQEATVADYERILSEQKELLNKIKLIALPELMAELELTGLMMDDGGVIEIEPDVKCSIPKKLKAKAMRWLTEHDFGGLIKTKVAVELDRDNHEKAAELSQLLSEDYDVVTLIEDVHASTLKSFVKEQLEKGTELPHDLFGIFEFKKATYKPTKKGK